MNKHKFKDWMIAVRPWSFPASAMPVIATGAYLFALKAMDAASAAAVSTTEAISGTTVSSGNLNWVNFVWALVNIIIFHAAGNTWSDWFDYRKKVDAEDTHGAKTLTSGMFTKNEIFWLSVGLLAVGIAAGLWLWLRTGMPLLYIGIGGALCSVLYPFMKYHALGDLVILLAYAVLPALGTDYVMTLGFDLRVLLLVPPIGLITVAILHCNNTRDIATDSRAHIRTLAMNIGKKASVRLYCFEILFPYLWVVGCVIAGAFPVWALLALASLIPAWANVRAAGSYLKTGSDAIASLDEATAKLQLLFSALLSLGFFIGALVQQ